MAEETRVSHGHVHVDFVHINTACISFTSSSHTSST